jgi:hypothetical protein
LLSEALNLGDQFLLARVHPPLHVVHLFLQFPYLATHAKNAINCRQIET